MELKIGTFNIQSGKDYKKFLNDGTSQIDISRASEFLSGLDLDICGLNEVRNGEKNEGGVNQAKEIAESLGYNFLFARAIDIRSGEYGNALVTKHKILSSQNYLISLPEDKRAERYEDRVIISADILAHGQVITVFASHFGLSEPEKALAVDIVSDKTKDIKHACILMGDFNLTPETEHYAALRNNFSDTADKNCGNKFTFTSANPTRTIDYIFVKNIRDIKSAQVLPDIVSDHCALIANIVV